MFEFEWLYIFAWLMSVAIIIWWYEAKFKKNRIELQEFKAKSKFLEDELWACRNKFSGNSKSKIADSFAEERIKANLVDFIDANKEIINKNDLKIVEGIGPKIEKLLNNESIYTFEDLSKISAVEIKKILEKAGSRYIIHNPSTWPKQAELAHQGKWDELKKWQNELDKGRIVQ